ncbi:MAG: hypothetical protein ACM37W_14170 [Actinomycetota bacterium]
MVIIAYLIISLIVFSVWFTKFLSDTTTPKDDRISWIALIVGPLLWPIVLPLSILELMNKKRHPQPTASEWENLEILEEIASEDSLHYPVVTPSQSE